MPFTVTFSAEQYEVIKLIRTAVNDWRDVVNL